MPPLLDPDLDVALGSPSVDDVVAAALPDFADKYAPLLGGQTLDQWREVFTLPVVVTLRALVTWRYTADGLVHRSVVG